MLDVLRSATGGWIAKAFIVMLSASFGVWGIADIFGGYGGSAIATVGETQVSNSTFQLAFQNRMQSINRQTGQGLTLEQARSFGLHTQVLGELISEATLDNDASEKGLGVSDEVIGRGIIEDPTFRDSFGSFSRAAYEQYLAYSGLSEQQYVGERRRAHIRRQLAVSLMSGSVAPQTLSDAFHRFTNETRTVKYIKLGADAIEPIGAPDDAALTAYFEDNREQFRAPEYRHIEIIEADAATIAASVEVSDEAVREQYESQINSLKEPEKREILQLLFTTKAEAQDAADKIAGGSTLLQVAADMGKSEADISLGLVGASAIFDPAIRDAAFALAEGAVSAPIQGALGNVLLQVKKIQPEKTPALEEVREKIRLELAARLAEDHALDMFDTVEDDRAAGLTFAEIAAKNNVKYRVIDAIDSDGKAMDGSETTGLPQISDVLKVVFDTDPGVEADPIQLTDSGFIWVNVVDIIDSRDRTIDEVRHTLDERWRKDQQKKRMSEKAKSLVDRLNAGETLEDIATTHGVEVLTSNPLKRSSEEDDFDKTVVSAIFATPRDGANSARLADGTGRILFRIDAIALEPSNPESQESMDLAENLTLSLSEDLLGTYVRVKQEKFGVTVNQRNLDVLTGQASDQGQF